MNILFYYILIAGFSVWIIHVMDKGIKSHQQPGFILCMMVGWLIYPFLLVEIITKKLYKKVKK